jgi:hypothetical protein
VRASSEPETDQPLIETRGRKRANPSDLKWKQIDAKRAEAQRTKESQEALYRVTRTRIPTTRPYTISSSTSRDDGAIDDLDGSEFEGAHPRDNDSTAPAHGTRKKQCRRVIDDNEYDGAYNNQDGDPRNLNLNGSKNRGQAKGVNPKAPAKTAKASRKLTKKVKDTRVSSTV